MIKFIDTNAMRITSKVLIMSARYRLKFFAAGLLLGAAGIVHAATYYFADCAAGSATACVPGDNSSPGTDPAAPKRDLTGLKLTAGDTYRFARGGAWADVKLRVYLPDSTKDRPTVFEDYTPSWGQSAPRPIFHGISKAYVLWFMDGATTMPDEGYVLRNLELRGPADGTGKGLVLYNDVDYVTAEGLLIRGFSIGVQVEKSSSPLGPGSDGNSSFFTLRNSTVSGNSHQGFLGGGFDMLIEGNTFDNNGYVGPVRYHNVYLSGYSDRAVVRGNTLTNNAVIDGVCTSVSLVAHGHHPRLTVEGNLVMESSTNSGCWGIVLDGNVTSGTTPQNFTGLVVRANRVVLKGNSTIGIGCSACPGAVIENNHIVRLGGETSFAGVRWPSSEVYIASRGDTPNGTVVVRNNSVFIDAPTRGHAGVKTSGAGSTGDAVISNLITFGPLAPADVRCFDTGGRAAHSFKSFDNNFCGREQGTVSWSADYSTLYTAQAVGFDVNGLTGATRLDSIPSPANGWVVRVKPDSQTVSSGHRSFSAPVDYSGRLRDDRPDIGAIELRRSVRPAPPTEVSAK